MEQTFAVGTLKITYDYDHVQLIKSVEVDLTPVVAPPQYQDITLLVLPSKKAVEMVEKLIDEYERHNEEERFESPEFLTFKILHSGKQNHS